MTLPPEARRDQWFKLRCSAPELLHLRDVAAAVGLTAAEWARRRLFGDRAGLPRPGVRPEPGPPGVPVLAAELEAAAARAERERLVAAELAAREGRAARGE
jgi:hypothetical protein